MSRGHGAVQRRILEQLQHNTNDPAEDTYANGHASWTTVLDLAGGDGATRAHIESTRRAVLKLAAEGLVETRHVSRERPGRYWGKWSRNTTTPLMLAARISVENISPARQPQHLSFAEYIRQRRDLSVDNGSTPNGSQRLSVDNLSPARGSQHLLTPDAAVALAHRLLEVAEPLADQP